MNLLLYNILLLLELRSAQWSAPSPHITHRYRHQLGQVLSLGPVSSPFDPPSSSPQPLVESLSFSPPTPATYSSVQPGIPQLELVRPSSQTPVAHCLSTGISPMHPEPPSSPGPVILSKARPQWVSQLTWRRLRESRVG